MADPFKPPAGRRPPTFAGHHAFGDSMPVGEVIERDTDTTWALWTDLVAAEDLGFADTVPMAALSAAPDTRSKRGLPRT